MTKKNPRVSTGNRNYNHGAILFRCGEELRERINAACEKYHFNQTAFLEHAVKCFLKELQIRDEFLDKRFHGEQLEIREKLETRENGEDWA